MKRTIYYLSSLKWFSKIRSERYSTKTQMLKAHINYIKKSASFIFNDEKTILHYSTLADKRINSRVAVSFNFALPNDLTKTESEKWIKDIANIIADVFKTDLDKIYIALHDKKDNKHIHIVVANLDKNNKSLRINRNELKELHAKMQEYIISQGYEIYKEPEGEGIEHLGTALHYDKELREMYEAYKKYKKELRELEKEIEELNEKRKQEKVIKIDLTPKHTKRTPKNQ